MTKRTGGFLSYKDEGSRMTYKTDRGLASIDLGRITFQEAHKKAWLHGLVLIANGRIRGRASVVPCPG